VSARTLGAASPSDNTTPSGDSTARIVSLSIIATTPAAESGSSVGIVAGIAGAAGALALLVVGAWVLCRKQHQDPSVTSPAGSGSTHDLVLPEHHRGGGKSVLPGAAADLGGCAPPSQPESPHPIP
jgi:hypothetical protein